MFHLTKNIKAGYINQLTFTDQIQKTALGYRVELNIPFDSTSRVYLDFGSFSHNEMAPSFVTLGFKKIDEAIA